MIQEGEKIPAGISLQYMDGKKVQNIDSQELFANQKTIIFAVPGAFTPTCSELHLPGYITHSYELKKLGIDQIICISVNDAFVMDAWARDHNVVDEVRFIADGNGDFTRALGLQVDMSKFGFGERSKRYSMLVEDGVIKMLNVEKGGGLDVSKAEVFLDLL